MTDKPNPTQSQFKGGPFLAAAFLCETVLREDNNVYSAIRIVDQFARSEPKASELPHTRLRTNLFLKFHSGQHSGVSKLTMHLYNPEGVEILGGDADLEFRGSMPYRVMYAVTPLLIPATLEGVYWMDIYVDGALITRLSILVQWEAPNEQAQP